MAYSFRHKKHPSTLVASREVLYKTLSWTHPFVWNVTGISVSQVPDLLTKFTDGREEDESAASRTAVLDPTQIREFETSVEVTMRRFASGLQAVLENVHK